MTSLTSISATVQRHRAAAALAAVPVLAAVIGAVLGWALRGDAGPSTTRAAASPDVRTFAAGDLRVTLPDGWSRVSPSLLPAGLDTGTRRPRIVRAGRVHAYHYVVALGANRVIDVYTAPTTQGTATVACSSAVYELGECETVVGALRLARGSFLAPSENAALLERLPAVVASLNARRAPLRTRLAKAPSAEAGARAADGLAAAYAAAARPLRPLVVRHGAGLATVRVLHRLRAEHVALADALRIGDRATFTLTAQTIRADEARLDRRLAAWQRALRSS
jgi:hypothetical protein